MQLLASILAELGPTQLKLVEKFLELIATADRELGQLGLKCKQLTVSGQKPSPAVSDDGLCLLIGGFGWFPEVDSVSVEIPPLHFRKSARGKLPKSTQTFKTSGNHKTYMESLNSFCPK